jgi:hypothetical protein
MNQELLLPALDGKTKLLSARRQLWDNTNRNKQPRCKNLKPNNDGWDEDDYLGNGPPPPLAGGHDSDNDNDNDNDDDSDDNSDDEIDDKIDDKIDEDHNDNDYYNDDNYNNDRLLNNSWMSNIVNHVSDWVRSN